MGLIADFIESKLKGIAVVLFVALLAVCAFLYMLYTSDQKKILEQEASIALKSQALITLQDSYDKLFSSNAVSEQKRAELAAEVSELKSQFQDIQDSSKKKIVQIVTKYQTLPQTPENTSAEKKDISTVRIDSMWDIFCKRTGLPEYKPCIERKALAASEAASK